MHAACPADVFLSPSSQYLGRRGGLFVSALDPRSSGPGYPGTYVFGRIAFSRQCFFSPRCINEYDEFNAGRGERVT